MEEQKKLYRGISRGGITVSVAEWNGYKNPVLSVYIEDDNTHYKVASFDSYDRAVWFIDKMREFLNGLVEESGAES